MGQSRILRLIGWVPVIAELLDKARHCGRPGVRAVKLFNSTVRSYFLAGIASGALGMTPVAQAEPAARRPDPPQEWRVKAGYPDSALSLRWRPDGKQVATHAGGNRLCIWDAQRAELQLAVPVAPYSADWTWTPDGKAIAARETLRRLTVWDVATGRRRASVLLGEAPAEVRWSPDGAHCVAYDFLHVSLYAVKRTAPEAKPALPLATKRGPVREVAWSPNSRWLLVATDQDLQLWDARTGKQCYRLARLERAALHGVAWSPDSRVLAIDEGRRFRFWQPLTSVVRSVRDEDYVEGTWISHTTTSYRLVWSPDGHTIARVAHGPEARIYSEAGQLRHILRSEALPWQLPWDQLTWSPDSRSIATTAGDALYLWDAASGKLRVKLRTQTEGRRPDRDDPKWGLTAPAWSPDGATLASAPRQRIPGGGGSLELLPIFLWDAGSGKLRREVRGHRFSVQSLTWSPSGDLLATNGEAAGPILWDGKSGQRHGDLVGEACPQGRAQWSPDGHAFAVQTPSDAAVLVWHTNRQAPVVLSGMTEGGPAPITGFQWSPDGRQLALSGRQGSVSVWEASTGRRLQILEGHQEPVWALAWRPGGAELAGSDGETVLVWSLATGEIRHRWEQPSGGAHELSWSPDGRLLATSGYGYDVPAALWDAGSGQLLHRLPEARWLLRWSRDGKTVSTGSAAGPSLLWDVSTGRARATLSGAWRTWWSPDGKRLASLSSEPPQLRFWDAEGGRVLGEAPGPVTHSGDSVWSPRGDWFATMSPTVSDQVVLWSPRTARIHATLGGHDGPVAEFKWSPSGNLLATAGADREVILWDPSSGRKKRQFRNVSPAAIIDLQWSPQGDTLLVAAGDGSFALWWAADATHLKTYYSSQKGDDWLTLAPGEPPAGSAKGRRWLAPPANSGTSGR